MCLVIQFTFYTAGWEQPYDPAQKRMCEESYSSEATCLLKTTLQKGFQQQ